VFGEGLHSLQEPVEESQRVLGVELPTVSSEAHGKIASVITNGYGGSQPLISKSRCSCSPQSVKGSAVTTEVAHLKFASTTPVRHADALNQTIRAVTRCRLQLSSPWSKRRLVWQDEDAKKFAISPCDGRI
jgi:hypothetical protein